MNDIQRSRFISFQDWHNYLEKIKESQRNGVPIAFNPSELRLACYKDIENLRGRPLIVYVTKFVNVTAQNAPVSIDISDVDGFTDLIQSIPAEHTSIDVLIHSPGGRPDATERLVYLLRRRFKEVHFLIPHSAYSAATMLALSGNSITLHTSSTLGPIDPQINGNPARAIKKGFNKVIENIKPETLPAYLPLLEKYSLELLEICEDSEKLSRELIKVWIKEYMLPDIDEAKVNLIVEYFSDYDNHLLHSRPLVFEKIEKLGLAISYADDALNKLLWEAYILIDGFFNISPFIKLFENTNGISWGRQFMQTQQLPQPQARQNEAIL